MPGWTIVYVAASFVYLLAGAAWGAWMLATKGQPPGPLPWSWRAWHVETMLFGWLTQFIWGIGYWIFPRFWTSRGRVWPIPWAWFSLNLGLTLSWLGMVQRALTWRLLGHGLIFVAAVLFLWHAWPRIKPPGA